MTRTTAMQPHEIHLPCHAGPLEKRAIARQTQLEQPLDPACRVRAGADTGPVARQDEIAPANWAKDGARRRHDGSAVRRGADRQR
jgi:hypothetical protein